MGEVEVTTPSLDVSRPKKCSNRATKLQSLLWNLLTTLTIISYTRFSSLVKFRQILASLARLTSIISHLRRSLPSITEASERITKATSAWQDNLGAGKSRRDTKMTSPPNNKSYLSGLPSFSPWGSRAPTPKPQIKDSDSKSSEPGISAQRGGDHTVSRRHRFSLRDYPRDCPPLSVQWYHAVDLPKRKPLHANQAPSEGPVAAPKKYVPFSIGDSKAIEAAFQKISEEEDAMGRERPHSQSEIGEGSDDPGVGSDQGAKLRKTGDEDVRTVRVPVNEDYLFDVDVERRELAPSYWLGPVYDVRRGTWFFQEGTTLRPCDENLATQLEQGYLKLKPWKFPKTVVHQRSASQPRSRPASMRVNEEQAGALKSISKLVTPKGSLENLKSKGPSSETGGLEEPLSPQAAQRSFRLFGAYMNSVVTFQDDSTAFIMTEDFLTRMSSGVYERFAGGAHFAGQKVVRGYADTGSTSRPAGQSPDAETEQPDAAGGEAEVNSPSEMRRQTLERHMSSLVESATNPEKQEEEIRRRDEKEIEDDYKDQDGDEQNREIEHLILVTHGIGQRLNLRMESVNFVHDVNTLRKTLKGVYNNSADLQALNGEVEKPTKNSRVQVLPICWRHLLDFPKQSLKHNRKEHDLGDADLSEDEEYPSLEDISVDGVPAIRNLITDLALDILLYQSPAYKGHITRIVLEEMNRIYKLFRERNPNFKGRVSLAGHSLGSAVIFDILCNQKADKQPYRSSSGHHEHKDNRGIQLDFEVEDFYALGSPIGLFQMLKGRTIAARKTPNIKPALTPFGDMDDPFLGSPTQDRGSSKSSGPFEISTSSPKCQRVFNIFHPTDPISYRLEPLISPTMASLKPQPLPYTKKGIFGAPLGQGFSGIGARVGQSVTGLWSSVSSGIASSLLNRSLGITGKDASKLSDSLSTNHTRNNLSVGAGTNITSGGVVSANANLKLAHNAEQLARGTLTIGQGEDGEHPPTLLDTDIETLFSGFQKRRKSQDDSKTTNDSDEAQWKEMEEQAKRVRREEAKLRALNSNGRVDYSIQEGAFDISLLASIASHLSYWADEDVSHFMISQLLARHRVLKDATTGKSAEQDVDMR
ncbi:DDHD-domain-containing protein [Tothia fuscella]|uniref:DDHD-domain-containing protein n=1 Tax=Tothia fuscella TaxID=1048955 RepID=A0A9P4P3I0_9PEZI|nr:DDHD-domain-containing protein [Tothia fuscella]